MSLATQSIFEAVVIKAIISRISPSLVVSDFFSAFNFLHLKWLEVAQFIHISRDHFVPFFAFSWFYYLRLLFFPLLDCAPFAQLHHEIFDLFLFLLPIQCLMTVYMRTMARRLRRWCASGWIGKAKEKTKSDDRSLNMDSSAAFKKVLEEGNGTQRNISRLLNIYADDGKHKIISKRAE